MFSVEIDFNDGLSGSETVLVRRPYFLIGGSDSANVSIDDMKSMPYDLMITRGLGKRFRCRPVSSDGNAVSTASLLDGIYEGTTKLDVGSISVQITSLDLDLMLREGEAPDRAGVRIIRQASVSKAPRTPALVFPGKNPFVVSFVPDQPIYIGRSRECTVRLDVQDISARHARVGYEAGQFWIEDLGSTNGTFLNQQQISGRVAFAPGVPVLLGGDSILFGANSDDQIDSLINSKEDRPRALSPERRYPVLLSISEVVRPARMVVPVSATIHIGRDPKSELWLGAPHISRQHCEVSLAKTGVLTVQDCSTNGTSYDGGLLMKGDTIDLEGQARVLDFGGGVTVAICFSADDEQIFLDSGGSVNSFIRKIDAPASENPAEKIVVRKPLPSGSRAYRSREFRTEQRPIVARTIETFLALPLLKKAVIGLWIGAVLMVFLVVGSLLGGLFS